jgi:hypothetical protein
VVVNNLKVSCSIWLIIPLKSRSFGKTGCFRMTIMSAVRILFVLSRVWRLCTGFGLVIGFISHLQLGITVYTLYNSLQLSLSGLSQQLSLSGLSLSHNWPLTLLSLLPGSRTSCRPTSLSPNCRLRLLCPWPPSQGPEPLFSDWLSELFSEDLTGQSQSHVTTDDQSGSKSWIWAPCGSCDRTLISVWHLRV